MRGLLHVVGGESAGMNDRGFAVAQKIHKGYQLLWHAQLHMHVAGSSWGVSGCWRWLAAMHI